MQYQKSIRPYQSLTGHQLEAALRIVENLQSDRPLIEIYAELAYDHATLGKFLASDARFLVHLLERYQERDASGPRS